MGKCNIGGQAVLEGNDESPQQDGHSCKASDGWTEVTSKDTSSIKDKYPCQSSLLEGIVTFGETRVMAAKP